MNAGRLSIATDFPIVIAVDVAWGEMDAYGHVNNTVFLRWFESARMRFLREAGFVDPSENAGIGPILGSTQCIFRRPVRFPDTVKVGTRIADLTSDRFTMEYQVFSTALQQVAAWGSGIVVAYDYGAGAKRDLPAAVRQRIEDIQSRQPGSANPA